jgi:hypothetical protein
MSGAAAARQSPEQPPDDDLGRMSFLDHLDELRTRIIHATLGVAAGLVLAGAFIKPILDFIIAPLDALLPQSSFFISTLFGLGLVFQMPTIAFFLAKMGVVTAKVLIRGFKYAVLASVVVGAIVTPSPDAWAQLVIAGTMVRSTSCASALWRPSRRKRREVPARRFSSSRRATGCGGGAARRQPGIGVARRGDARRRVLQVRAAPQPCASRLLAVHVHSTTRAQARDL